MTTALVPVKGLSTALHRLGALLSREEKARFSLTMLRDVLVVLKQARGLDGLVIVSREPAVQEVARTEGARVVEEPPKVVGEGPAVDYGAGLLSREGVGRVLVVPSDLPLVRVEDIEAVLQEDLGEPSVVMAPSSDGGTNALLKSPPDVIPSRFGPDSLALHIREAEAWKVPYRVLPLSSLSIDIDSPEDLATFINTPNSTLSLALAEEMGLRERLVQKRPSLSG